MKKITVITYHYVREIKESQFPKIKGLEFEGFKRQLDYLEKHYNLIKASQMIEYLLGGVRLPTNACLLSFDDGYKDHIKYVLPELMKRKIQGSFFPPVKSIVEREMLEVNSIQFILESCSNYEILNFQLNRCCLEKNISLILGGPYNSGILADPKFNSNSTYFYQKFPELYTKGSDLDILVSNDDEEKLKNYLIQNPGNIKIDVWNESAPSYSGVSYFLPRLSKKILETSIPGPAGSFIPAKKEALLSLMYHVIYHKGINAGITSTTAGIESIKIPNNKYKKRVTRVSNSTVFVSIGWFRSCRCRHCFTDSTPLGTKQLFPPVTKRRYFF